LRAGRSSSSTRIHRAKEASFDYYSFLRNAYSQRRTALVNDSGEKTKEEEDELYKLPPP